MNSPILPTYNQSTTHHGTHIYKPTTPTLEQKAHNITTLKLIVATSQSRKLLCFICPIHRGNDVIMHSIAKRQLSHTYSFYKKHMCHPPYTMSGNDIIYCMLWSWSIVLFSFMLIWIVSDYVLKSVTNLSERLNISSFAISFLTLGVLTSLPEFFIGINAIIINQPVIFVGNLLGASFVIFALIIPLFALVGNGIVLDQQISKRYLFFSLWVVAAPVIITLDYLTSRQEALLLMSVYAILILYLRKEKSWVEQLHDLFQPHVFHHIWRDVSKIFLGAFIMFIAARLLVHEATAIADIYAFDPFIMSLVFFSIGSNLPELFIGVRSILQRQKDVAFGDYLGSATANTFFFGVLVMINGGFFLNSLQFTSMAMLLIIVLLLFFFFTQKDNIISRYEGLLLLILYCIFVSVELML